ncbi:MAG TPA: aldehyde dehydrogenase family protein, partial [bacterium]|nr:aldehyde dehydrogenase family protein [bacterium]
MAVTAQAYKLVIDGHEVAAAAGRVAVVTSPATGEPVASVPVADEQDVDRAVRSARRAFEEGPWPKMAASERGRVLLRIGALLRERVESLALLEVQSGGKPIRDARAEVLAAAECFEYYAGAATKWFGETIPVTDRGLDFTLREPIGVVGLIVPWNFPLMIASWKVAPAL